MAEDSPGPLGVVLAGGASTRFGRDKATFELAGERLVDRAVRLLREADLEVVVADAGRDLVPAVSSIPDGPGSGPAAGLLGVRAAHPDRPLVALACDLPGVPAALLRHLATMRPEADLVVPRHDGRLQPLCARWGPRALATLRQRVESSRLALHELAEHPDLEVAVLDPEVLTPFGPPDRLFHNLNAPEDVEHR